MNVYWPNVKGTGTIYGWSTVWTVKAAVFTSVQHTSPHRTHAHTPNVMLPHHHIDFLHF